MNLNLEIKPMIGLGDLKFGMTAAEIEKLVGIPEEIEEIDDEEAKTKIWHFWSKGMSLFFEDENESRLSSIEIDNSNATIWDKKAFEMNEKELTDLFVSKGYNEMDSEMQEWGEKRLSFDDAMIDLYFDDAELVSINYSVLINEEENPVWPN
jgi:hypothetical protein